MNSKKDKTVVICGGSKGIGLACVEEFLEGNFQVIILSRTTGFISEDILNKVKHYPVDFHDLENLKKVASEIFEKYSPEVLINNSGGPSPASFENVNENDYFKSFTEHLLTSHILVSSFLPGMKKNKYGRIMNIVSVTAKVPLPNLCVSNTLRGAIINWSKTLSKELAGYGITVNNILPGYTETERLTEVIKSASKKLNITEEEYRNKLLNEIPSIRFARPKEISSLAYFLASKNAGYINGQSIAVDGGWSPAV